MIDRAAILLPASANGPPAPFCAARRCCICPAPPWGVDCAEVWLKLEHLQVGGSFKARGMLYRLLANRCPTAA